MTCWEQSLYKFEDLLWSLLSEIKEIRTKESYKLNSNKTLDREERDEIMEKILTLKKEAISLFKVEAGHLFVMMKRFCT